MQEESFKYLRISCAPQRGRGKKEKKGKMIKKNTLGAFNTGRDIVSFFFSEKKN
jgi:hypothetical protein